MAFLNISTRIIQIHLQIFFCELRFLEEDRRFFQILKCSEKLIPEYFLGKFPPVCPQSNTVLSPWMLSTGTSGGWASTSIDFVAFIEFIAHAYHCGFSFLWHGQGLLDTNLPPRAFCQPAWHNVGDGRDSHPKWRWDSRAPLAQRLLFKISRKRAEPLLYPHVRAFAKNSSPG